MLKAVVREWGFWILAMVVWEAVLRLTAFPGLSLRVLTVAGFLCVAAGAMALLTGLPGWAGRICGWIFPPLCFVIYAVQLVYYDIFGSLLSLGFVSMGGEAITAFWSIVLSALWRCLLRLIVMAVPLVAFYFLRSKQFFQPQKWPGRLGIGVGSALLLTVLVVSAERLPSNATIDHWADRYGLLAAEALDLKQLFFGTETGSLVPNGSGEILEWSSEDWNVMDELDFEQLTEAAQGDGDLENLTAYFAAQSATEKNEYTGMFEGYNLIVVCAEAYSPYLIDEELTPTLYRLSQGGIVFENFYNCFPNLTTNGEYSLCMGLLPDLTRMSFSRSANNYEPFTLAHLATNAGMSALGYHNNYGTFYNRVQTHTNMGYDFKAIGCGLDIEKGFPTSDLKMMEASVDDYLDQEPFHAYYMTYSGHAEYTRDENEMSDQNWDLVAGLEGSEEYLGYLACQLELERAMAYLVQRLEEAGIAQRTVIVLTGDHMPYGLPEEDYVRLAGEEAVQEPFWQYRNSFICWTPGLEEQPIVVDDYCCTIDILPTLCNLFGFEYDSRLLAGRDVLAEGEHIALLKNGSFLAQGVYYDSTTGEFTWEEEPDEERALTLLQTVENQFAMSAAVLSTDYYRFAFSTLGLLDESQAETPDVPSFTDIEGTWYEEDVETLMDLGVVQGSGFGTFYGEITMSRAEMLAMVTRSLQIPFAEIELPYTDVKQGVWYMDALTGAYAAGLLPEGETTFRAAAGATVDETLGVLTGAAKYAQIRDAENWAKETMEAAMEYQAQDSGCEAEEGTVSRGAMAHLVVELLTAAGEI